MMPPCTKPLCCGACGRRTVDRQGRSWQPGRLLDVYVNVNLAHLILTAASPELLAHALLEGRDLGELRLDVGALLQQALPVRVQDLAEALELRPLVAPRLVHVDELADLGEGEPEALAAQRELEARTVARRVDAPLARAARREEALVFVKPDGARGDVELARECADRKFGALR